MCYHVECLLTAPTAFLQAIPFLQRFEVGLIPDISDFQRRKGIVDMKLSVRKC